MSKAKDVAAATRDDQIERFCKKWFQTEETGDEECDAEDLESMISEAKRLFT